MHAYVYVSCIRCCCLFNSGIILDFYEIHFICFAYCKNTAVIYVPLLLVVVVLVDSTEIRAGRMNCSQIMMCTSGYRIISSIWRFWKRTNSVISHHELCLATCTTVHKLCNSVKNRNIFPLWKGHSRIEGKESARERTQKHRLSLQHYRLFAKINTTAICLQWVSALRQYNVYVVVTYSEDTLLLLSTPSHHLSLSLLPFHSVLEMRSQCMLISFTQFHFSFHPLNDCVLWTSRFPACQYFYKEGFSVLCLSA